MRKPTQQIGVNSPIISSEAFSSLQQVSQGLLDIIEIDISNSQSSPSQSYGRRTSGTRDFGEEDIGNPLPAPDYDARSNRQD